MGKMLNTKNPKLFTYVFDESWELAATIKRINPRISDLDAIEYAKVVMIDSLGDIMTLLRESPSGTIPHVKETIRLD